MSDKLNQARTALQRATAYLAIRLAETEPDDEDLELALDMLDHARGLIQHEQDDRLAQTYGRRA